MLWGILAPDPFRTRTNLERKQYAATFFLDIGRTRRGCFACKSDSQLPGCYFTETLTSGGTILTH